MKKKVILLFTLLTYLLSECNTKNSSYSAAPAGKTNVESVTINLVSVGDMLMHRGASVPASCGDGVFNYDYIFSNVKEAISLADLAIANNEVIMAGNELGKFGDGNIGYPCFNVRTEFGDAEVKAGFDVILGAGNHSMDQDVSGILNTVNYWKTEHPEISLLGLHDSAESASDITIRNVNGIKIAMLNYTYGLNGFKLPQEYVYAVDLMNQYTKAKISDDIRRAKKLADFVIIFPHWGTEYSFEENKEQQEWADFFAEEGVDLVIGTHPHVIQPVKWITASNGHRMLVYYSLGNFISIQYYNYSMLGGMANVKITKDSAGTYISSYDIDFLVTHFVPGRTTVTTYFLDDYNDELASRHGILTEPAENFMRINRDYPFTKNGMKELAKKICPDLV